MTDLDANGKSGFIPVPGCDAIVCLGEGPDGAFAVKITPMITPETLAANGGANWGRVVSIDKPHVLLAWYRKNMPAKMHSYMGCIHYEIEVLK